MIGDLKIDLYSICGFFSDPHFTKRAQSETLIKLSFGGYFKYVPVTRKLGDGRLIDILGPSSIEGFMDNEKLEFKKKYDQGGYVNYKFKKVDNVWHGEWKISRDDGYHANGEAVALSSLVTENAADIICRTEGNVLGQFI